MSNRKQGTDFERQFCELLFNHGFWVMNIPQTQAGQPADVIAVKNTFATLIDCKVCENDTFPISRIEENQRNAMNLWSESGNGQGWFALKTSKGVRMMSLRLMDHAKKSTLNLEDIVTHSMSVSKWIEKYGGRLITWKF